MRFLLPIYMYSSGRNKIPALRTRRGGVLKEGAVASLFFLLYSFPIRARNHAEKRMLFQVLALRCFVENRAQTFEAKRVDRKQKGHLIQ